MSATAMTGVAGVADVAAAVCEAGARMEAGLRTGRLPPK